MQAHYFKKSVSFWRKTKQRQMNKLSSQKAVHWGTDFPAASQCSSSAALAKAKLHQFSSCSWGCCTAKNSRRCLCKGLVGSGLQMGMLKLSLGISYGSVLNISRTTLNWTCGTYKSGLHWQYNSVLIRVQLICALFLLRLQSSTCKSSGSSNL